MQLLRFDRVDSTNEEAKRLLSRHELSDGGFVIAREQTAGRGSRGRTWHSPRDAGIYLSLVEMPLRRVTRLVTLHTLAAGVACAEVLERTAGVQVALRPVNDLCVEGRKLGGILTEAAVEAGNLRSLVVGVGINLRKAPRPVEAGSMEPVSLEEILPPEALRRLKPGAIVAALVTSLSAWNQLAADREIETIKSAWERRKVPGTSFPDPGPEIGRRS